MSSIALLDTQAIRDRVPILALASKHVTLTDSKAGYSYGACPICGEGDDRFKVWPDSGMFYCRRCEKRGDVIQLQQEIRNLDFVTAVKSLANGYTNGMAAPSAEAPGTPDFDRDAWRERLDGDDFKPGMIQKAITHLLDMESPEAQQARLWLERRGITTEAIGRWGLGYNDHWREIIPGYKLPPGILIPRYDADWQLQAVNVYLDKQARSLCDTRRMFVKGSHAKTFMGEHRIATSEMVVITEGELDCVLLDRFVSTHASVVTTGGADTIPDDLDVLEGKTIALCFDNDEAGGNGAKRWAARLPDAEIITSPKGNDVTDAYIGGFDLSKWLKGVMA